MILPFKIFRVLNFGTQKCYSILLFNAIYKDGNCGKCRWFYDSPVVYKNSPKTTKFKIKTLKPKLKSVGVWDNITIRELAKVLNVKTDDVLSFIPASVTIDVNEDTQISSMTLIKEILKNFGRQCVVLKNPKTEEKVKKEPVKFNQFISKSENLVPRPPVVTVMGHVDHGKTTLLDSLRNTFVVEEEFGGITQHIGAFSLITPEGKKITFIDTPGHAAFTAMRSRGAEVTDLVVLVIAADDGIMDQTIESIRIANKANVKIIVAVNKIDKVKALSIDSIKEKLLTEGIQVEDKGGDIQMVPISALKKINLDLLIQMILLEADVMELKGDPTGLVEGVIIESKVDKRGLLATAIIKRGTLKKQKILVAGKAHARVRLMLDENGKEFSEALPSDPVQILGWKELPLAGEKVYEVASEKEALKFVKQKEKEEYEKKQLEDEEIIQLKSKDHDKVYRRFREEIKAAVSVKDRTKLLYEWRQSSKQEEKTEPAVNIILKGDVFGSLEVLTDIINTYKEDHECRLFVVGGGVGDITINDVELAETFNGIIYAFNVKIHPSAEKLIKEKQIDVRFHNVLYKLIDNLKEELSSKIPQKEVEEIIGEAEVNEQFLINVKNKKIPVAGCKCTKGMLKKDSLYRVMRGDDVIYEGKLVSLKHFKNEVSIIQKNVMCGLMFDSFSDQFLSNDKIICYEKVMVSQTSSWNPGF